MRLKSKYRSVKNVGFDGGVYDSKREARRWDQLCLMQKAGEITELRRQVPYELIPAQYETYERYGKKGQRLADGVRLLERKVEYVADFVYSITATGENVVEDAKGVRTKDYIIKRKLMLAVHGIRIKEV